MESNQTLRAAFEEWNKKRNHVSGSVLFKLVWEEREGSLKLWRAVFLWISSKISCCSTEKKNWKSPAISVSSMVSNSSMYLNTHYTYTPFKFSEWHKKKNAAYGIKRYFSHVTFKYNGAPATTTSPTHINSSCISGTYEPSEKEKKNLFQKSDKYPKIRKQSYT